MRNVVISCCVALVACVPGVSIGQTGVCPPVDFAEMKTYTVMELTQLWQSYEKSVGAAKFSAMAKLYNNNYNFEREDSVIAACELQQLRVERLIRAKGGDVPVRPKESK